MIDPYLVIVDADRIHEYVFSPSTLKLVRGASALQSQLNQGLKVEAVRRGATAIYSGGGTLMAFFPSDAAVAEYIRWAEDYYFAQTGLATATAVAQKWCWPSGKRPDDEEDEKKVQSAMEDGFKATASAASLALSQRKAAARNPKFNGGSPFWKLCETCGLHPAVEKTALDDKFLCRACAIKLAKNDKNPYISEVAQRAGLSIIPSEDFEHLGALSVPENYLALIYLDVDGLGKHLNTTRSQSSSTYSDASRNVGNSIREGVLEACADIARTHRANNAPFEILLLGGDDAVVMVAAQYAIPFLKKFQAAFQASISSCELDRELTVSAGVVWANASYPMARFLENAEFLLRSAKRISGFAVDFMVVTEALVKMPERDSIPTARPYQWKELMEIAGILAKWKSSGFPANKVHALYSIAYKDQTQAELEFCFLLSRLSPKHRELLRDVFPRSLFEGIGNTKAADLVELWSFCSEGP